MARKKRHTKKRSTRRKSGLFLAKSGKRRPRRKSGATMGLEGWKGALIASSLMRFSQGVVSYLATTQNMGQELPKIKIIVPGLVAVLAKQGIIPVPGMFPAAVASLVDAAVDNTKFLKDIFDLKFMSQKPAAGKQGLFLGDLPDSPRRMSGLFLTPSERSGYRKNTPMDSYNQASPFQTLMGDRIGYNR